MLWLAGGCWEPETRADAPIIGAVAHKISDHYACISTKLSALIGLHAWPDNADFIS
jgi:hypothetical protein